MRISGGLLAHQATLGADEGKVILASFSRRLFWEGKTDVLLGRSDEVRERIS